MGKDLTISKISSVYNAPKSTSTSFSGVNVTGAPAVASQYNQPLLESSINTTNNTSLADNRPNNTSDQGSNSAWGYDDDHGSSSKSRSTTDSENDGNSRKTNRSPSSDKSNLGETTSNTKDVKSDSSSASHKSNHHTDSISKGDLTGDNNINKKMDRLKNRILEKDNDQQHRDKIPLKLPIPFP